MRFTKSTLGKLICAMAIAGTSTTTFAAEDCPVPNNLRIVIGSTSTGGDTYQNSAIAAKYLEKELDINAKVDAIGGMASFKLLERISNGSTVMIYHDQAYLGNLYGVKGYPDIFEKFIIGPTIAVNPGNAYLVPKDSPYESLEDIIQAAANGDEVRVAIQPGGVSEIGFTALKNAVKVRYPGKEKNIVAVNTGSQADKNQLLFADLADVINGSVQANEQYTNLPADDPKAMRFVWLTASQDVMSEAPDEGMGQTNKDELMQYVYPNVKVTMGDEQYFTFDKEFYFLYNKDTDPKMIKCIDEALESAYAKGEIQKEQKKAFFIPSFKPSEKAQEFERKRRDTYEDIIDNINS